VLSVGVGVSGRPTTTTSKSTFAHAGVSVSVPPGVDHSPNTSSHSVGVSDAADSDDGDILAVWRVSVSESSEPAQLANTEVVVTTPASPTDFRTPRLLGFSVTRPG